MIPFWPAWHSAWFLLTKEVNQKKVKEPHSHFSVRFLQQAHKANPTEDTASLCQTAQLPLSSSQYLFLVLFCQHPSCLKALWLMATCLVLVVAILNPRSVVASSSSESSCTRALLGRMDVRKSVCPSSSCHGRTIAVFAAPLRPTQGPSHQLRRPFRLLHLLLPAHSSDAIQQGLHSRQFYPCLYRPYRGNLHEERND
jgi:hypothetical protein